MAASMTPPSWLPAASERYTVTKCAGTRSSAEQVALDCFGVGEHHREDFAVSAPEVVLAAIGGRTSRIALGSAVTVLGTDDPVQAS